MKVHMQKQTNVAAIGGISLSRLACVKSPFVKGIILSGEEFAKRYAITPDDCCSKCVVIAKRKGIIKQAGVSTPACNNMTNQQWQEIEKLAKVAKAVDAVIFAANANNMSVKDMADLVSTMAVRKDAAALVAATKQIIKS